MTNVPFLDEHIRDESKRIHQPVQVLLVEHGGHEVLLVWVQSLEEIRLAEDLHDKGSHPSQSRDLGIDSLARFPSIGLDDVLENMREELQENDIGTNKISIHDYGPYLPSNDSSASRNGSSSSESVLSKGISSL